MLSRSAARLSALLYNTHSHTHTHTYTLMSVTYILFLHSSLFPPEAHESWVVCCCCYGLDWPFPSCLLCSPLLSFILAESKHNPIFLCCSVFLYYADTFTTGCERITDNSCLVCVFIWCVQVGYIVFKRWMHLNATIKSLLRLGNSIFFKPRVSELGTCQWKMIFWGGNNV